MLRIAGLFVLVFFAVFGLVVWFPQTNYTLFTPGGFPITIPMLVFFAGFATLMKVTA
jgi:hypothetical protein